MTPTGGLPPIMGGSLGGSWIFGGKVIPPLWFCLSIVQFEPFVVPTRV